MGKKIGQVNESTGKVETGKPRGQRAKLIPWTPAPTTRAQRVARALWG